MQAGYVYCDTRIAGAAEVDRFIAWSRHPDNGIKNLVVADWRRNSFKPATERLERWRTERSGTAEAATCRLWPRPRASSSLRHRRQPPAESEARALSQHSCATHLLDAGEPIDFVQDLLGHRNTESSLVYARGQIGGEAGR